MAFTYFFRDLQTLDLIVEHVIPFSMGRSKIHVWDAGCASGQEPYSLAIIFAEKMGAFAFKNLRILASDIDESNLFRQIIENGIYPYDQLKRIPNAIFQKYFKPADKNNEFAIDEDLRRRVEYLRHDLLKLKPPMQGFSLVMCKNVLLHFQPNERIKVINMFYDVLLPGGYFAMEQTQKLPDELKNKFIQVVSNAQLYKKPE